MNNEWNDASVARLKELIALGWSAGMIGQELGLSRGTVCGKMYRLDLRTKNSQGRQRVSGPKRPRGTPWAPVPVFVEPEALPIPSALLQLVVLAELPHERWRGAPWAVLNLQHDECRFPLGDPKHLDFRFCCALRKSRNYCADHAQFDCYAA